MRKNTFWCSFKHHQLTSGCPRQIALQSIYVNSSMQVVICLHQQTFGLNQWSNEKKQRQDMVVLIQ